MEDKMTEVKVSNYQQHRFDKLKEQNELPHTTFMAPIKEIPDPYVTEDLTDKSIHKSLQTPNASKLISDRYFEGRLYEELDAAEQIEFDMLLNEYMRRLI